MCASVVSPHRQTAGSTTRECVRRKAASFKSASVYECFPFTWPYNAQTADLPRECGPAAPVKEVDQPVSSQTTAYPEVLSPVPEALDATGQGYSICGDLAHRARHPRRHL